MKGFPKAPPHKLSAAQEDELFELYSSNVWTMSRLSKRFGCSIGLVSKIVNTRAGESFKDVGEKYRNRLTKPDVARLVYYYGISKSDASRNSVAKAFGLTPEEGDIAVENYDKMPDMPIDRERISIKEDREARAARLVVSIRRLHEDDEDEPTAEATEAGEGRGEASSEDADTPTTEDAVYEAPKTLDEAIEIMEGRDEHTRQVARQVEQLRTQGINLGFGSSYYGEGTR